MTATVKNLSEYTFTLIKTMALRNIYQVVYVLTSNIWIIDAQTFALYLIISFPSIMLRSRFKKWLFPIFHFYTIFQCHTISQSIDNNEVDECFLTDFFLNFRSPLYRHPLFKYLKRVHLLKHNFQSFFGNLSGIIFKEMLEAF